MRTIWKLFIPFICFNTFALEIRPESGAVTFTMIDVLSKAKNKSLSVSRFYNSAASQDGWFGKSFSSNFETRLQKEADGSLTIFEYGQIPGIVYSPLSGTAKTEELIEEILKKKSEFSGTAVESFRKKLLTDREFLRTTAEELNLKGTPAEGETFRSGIFGGQTVKFSKNIFTRELSEGRSESFDLSGKLVSVSFPAKSQKVELTYSKEGRLKSLTDNYQNRILVEWGTDGHIQKLANGINGKSAVFRYENDKLTSVTNEAGDTYGYAYDQYGLLTRITSLKGTTDITYDPRKRSPVEVINSKGPVEKWFFDLKKTNEGDLRIARREVKIDNKVTKESWETLIASGTTGNIPRQMKTVDDNGEILTRFRPCCYPQPEYIVTPSLKVSFLYDSQDRLTEKKFEGFRTVKIQYDAQGRLSTVADDERVLKFEFSGASLTPVAYQGKGFRLESLQRNKSKDTFRIQWDGEKSFHQVEYLRNTQRETTLVKLDGEEIVKNGLAQTEKNKLNYLKLEDALMHMNLLSEVSYDF